MIRNATTSKSVHLRDEDRHTSNSYSSTHRSEATDLHKQVDSSTFNHSSEI